MRKKLLAYAALGATGAGLFFAPATFGLSSLVATYGGGTLIGLSALGFVGEALSAMISRPVQQPKTKEKEGKSQSEKKEKSKEEQKKAKQLGVPTTTPRTSAFRKPYKPTSQEKFDEEFWDLPPELAEKYMAWEQRRSEPDQKKKPEETKKPVAPTTNPPTILIADPYKGTTWDYLDTLDSFDDMPSDLKARNEEAEKRLLEQQQQIANGHLIELVEESVEDKPVEDKPVEDKPVVEQPASPILNKFKKVRKEAGMDEDNILPPNSPRARKPVDRLINSPINSPKI